MGFPFFSFPLAPHSVPRRSSFPPSFPSFSAFPRRPHFPPGLVPVSTWAGHRSFFFFTEPPLFSLSPGERTRCVDRFLRDFLFVFWQALIASHGRAFLAALPSPGDLFFPHAHLSSLPFYSQTVRVLYLFLSFLLALTRFFRGTTHVLWGLPPPF